MLAARAPLPLVLRVPLLAGGLLAITMSAAAVLTTWWVFGASARHRWDWVEDAAGRANRWLNLTTGFDDSTPTLRQRLGGEGRALDVFDPMKDHEPALQRARDRFPPAGRPVAATLLDDAIEAASADAVLMLMSAHEAHGPDRVELFRSAARALTPDGRLVVVEHLRDLANSLAFGPGAWHFSTRTEWLAVAEAAGLALTIETRLSPFVAGFVFSPKPATIARLA
jgi:SAM-dependent methyltransferase